MTGIQSLSEKVTALSDDERIAFERIFEIEHQVAMPGEQRITVVRNRWTGEQTSFNEMRRRRAPPASAVRALAERCRRDTNCEICSFRHAPREGMRSHGRCFYVPAATRFTRHHLLLFLDEHNPTRFPIPDVTDMFVAASRWACEAVSRNRIDSAHYQLSWNVLCGSAIHAHAQATLSQAPLGGARRLREDAARYLASSGQDLLGDLASVHAALGLSFEVGPATAFASLTPMKERELWLVCPSDASATLPPGLEPRLCELLQELSESAGAPCPAFNISITFPTIGGLPDSAPVLIRIVDRGWPLLGVCDWATMEMFGTRIVATDPFAVHPVARSRRA